MSQTNLIKFLLDIQEKNISFSSDFYREQGKYTLAKVIPATLTSDSCSCPHCASAQIVKNGFLRTRIRYIPFQNYSTILDLKKQRFLCKACKHSFVLESSLVKKNTSISTNLKLSILMALKENMSLTLIAKQHHVSVPTVQRILEQGYFDYEISKKRLPEVLCFDEFKSTKDSDGAMSFLFLDAKTHQILDIIEDRKLHSLQNYFSNFSYTARANVKYIVMDLYSPYISLAKHYFPNAKIVLDPFHLVNLVNRSLNKTRIQQMNLLQKTEPRLARCMKQNWRLLLQDCMTLTETRYYCSSWKCMVSSDEKVRYMLNKNNALRRDYDFYQNMLYAMKRKDFPLFEKYLESARGTLSHGMQISCKTLRKYRNFIRNTLETNYSNGPLEGMNNFVKSVKRVAFGFRKFSNFRKRILIMRGLAQLNPKFA